MPDFQSHSVQAQADGKLVINPISITVDPNNAANSIITVPTANISNIPILRAQARVVDSQTQQLLPGGNFTGANAIDMALKIPGLGVQAHREIAESIAQSIMRRRLGLE